MTVGRILEQKGRDVSAIAPTASIKEVVGELARLHIGALVVSEGEGRELQGIISERDVVRLLARDGSAALDATVADVMTRNLVTANEQTSIDEALDIMTRGRFRHLPVCENRRLVGLVSIGDVVKHRIEAAERQSEDLLTYIHAAG